MYTKKEEEIFFITFTNVFIFVTLFTFFNLFNFYLNVFLHLCYRRRREAGRRMLSFEQARTHERTSRKQSVRRPTDGRRGIKQQLSKFAARRKVGLQNVSDKSRNKKAGVYSWLYSERTLAGDVF